MSGKSISGYLGSSLLFLTIGLYNIILAFFSIPFIPYKQWGGNTPLEPWQMYGIGIISLVISALIFWSGIAKRDR